MTCLNASPATADSPLAADSGPSQAAAHETSVERERRLPFYREWFEDRGIDLPLPYGAGLMSIFMERDIEVTDVSVRFLDRPPESISDRADFEVANQTRSLAGRFDAWVLPFLNVYGLAGKATTNTSLRTRITIDRPVGEPIELDITEDSSVDGPMIGLGLTAVIGGDAWFAMADANYTIADVDLFDDEVKAWLLSARLGWHGATAGGTTRVWGGLFYMDSERTLRIVEDVPLIGPTDVFVTQRPADPLTYQVGASVTLAQRWDLMVEAGTNFDDARLLVLSASYRF